MVTEVEMTTAMERARIGLCRMIAAGELRPGEALPSEAALCGRFEVSRSSLREAQKMLVAAGALTHHRGGRMTVSEMTPEHVLKGLHMVVPLLPLDRFIDLFPLRELLEGHCAALSAARLDDDSVQRLQQMARELTALEPGDKAQLLDSQYHALIIDGAGDPMISALLGTLRKRGREFRIYEDRAHADLKQVSDDAHLAIADAIAARDPESARFLAMNHVRTTRAWLEEIRPGPSLFDAAEVS